MGTWAAGYMETFSSTVTSYRHVPCYLTQKNTGKLQIRDGSVGDLHSVPQGPVRPGFCLDSAKSHSELQSLQLCLLISKRRRSDAGRFFPAPAFQVSIFKLITMSQHNNRLETIYRFLNLTYTLCQTLKPIDKIIMSRKALLLAHLVHIFSQKPLMCIDSYQA